MIKNKFKIFVSLLISAVLLSGCSIIPEFPEENVSLVSLDGTYQITASNDWENIPDSKVEDDVQFDIYSKKKNTIIHSFAEKHIVYTAYTFENYCNQMIKDWFCDELNIVFPETYSEETVLGKRVRWYEGYDLVETASGEKKDYFCYITEIGEKETEKTFFVVYGFLDDLNDDIKQEVLGMFDSMNPIGRR